MSNHENEAAAVIDRILNRGAIREEAMLVAADIQARLADPTSWSEHEQARQEVEDILAGLMVSTLGEDATFSLVTQFGVAAGLHAGEPDAEMLLVVDDLAFCDSDHYSHQLLAASIHRLATVLVSDQWQQQVSDFDPRVLATAAHIVERLNAEQIPVPTMQFRCSDAGLSDFSDYLQAARDAGEFDDSMFTPLDQIAKTSVVPSVCKLYAADVGLDADRLAAAFQAGDTLTYAIRESLLTATSDAELNAV